MWEECLFEHQYSLGCITMMHCYKICIVWHMEPSLILHKTFCLSDVILFMFSVFHSSLCYVVSHVAM